MTKLAAGGSRAPGLSCPRCGTEVAPDLLHCPSCRWLVHGAELEKLAVRAESASTRGAPGQARDAWRAALALLPSDSTQASQVRARIEHLGRQMEKHGAGPATLPDERFAAIAAQGQGPSPEAARPHPSWKAIGIGAGSLGLLLWKFKFVLGFIVTKGKLLLLGLTKASTFFSMILSLGLYASLFGWRFAAGLIASIYVHEMGHVAALRKLGIRASAPMFIPGFGALVRLREYPASPREDARVGLAGPIWGLGASLAALGAFYASGWPIFAAVAKVGAWLNLFNLIPVWQLDGSRGFRALDRSQRVLVLATAAGIGLWVEEALFLLIVAAGAYRMFSHPSQDEGDARTLAEFAVLIVGLGLLCGMSVPGVG